MKISASIKSNYNHHDLMVKTDEVARDLLISPGPTGFGSSVSGAELLLLSLATCFSNDFYREAARRSIKYTDRNTEIHNTLRKGVSVTLNS